MLVDAQKTRVDLLDDESSHFKESYENINTEYFRIKKQFEELAQKLVNQDDEIKRCQTERAEVVKKHNLVSPRQSRTFNFSKFASPKAKDKANVN